MDSNQWFLLESTQLIITPVLPRNNYNYELHHHNFDIDTVLTLSTRDVEHFCHSTTVSHQQRAWYYSAKHLILNDKQI